VSAERAEIFKKARAMIRPESFPTPFCAGCGHGILMHAILRAVAGAELDMNKMLFASGIGCAAWIPSPHFKADTLHTTHGRAIPFATGAKAVNPELEIVVISGDGDLASIGGNHFIHAARRRMPMTVICANNFIYGMTGGQVAATTPPECRTATTPEGNRERPFNLAHLAWAAGADFVARATVSNPMGLERVILRALKEPGFRFVDVLSTCPTQFGRRSGAGDAKEMLEYLKTHTKSGDLMEEFAGKTEAGVLTLGEISRSGRIEK
jgi:2-oxoglutarate ferredoxin oxidoreductase subunit beta